MSECWLYVTKDYRGTVKDPLHLKDCIPSVHLSYKFLTLLILSQETSRETQLRFPSNQFSFLVRHHSFHHDPPQLAFHPYAQHPAVPHHGFFPPPTRRLSTLLPPLRKSPLSTPLLSNLPLTPRSTLKTSASALLHTIVLYLSPPTRSLIVFSGPKAPPHATSTLLARTYGLKNVYTALIRGYAAYHVTNPQVYALAVWTFVGVLAYYLNEWGVQRTVGTREVAWPFVTAGVGLVWMVLGWEGYVG